MELSVIEENNRRMNSLMAKARSNALRPSEKLELNTLHAEYMKELAKNPIPKITTGKTNKNKSKKFKIERA